jgi:thiosulfate dehydrogenase (quinone) large subunit
MTARKVNQPAETFAVVFLRISAGIMFLRAMWPKVSAFAEWPGRMLGFLHAQQNTPDWYRAFLDGVVAPNAEVFAFLTAYGELTVGILLVVGVFCRPAALGGLVLVTNYWLAKGVPFWSPASNDSYLILILVALFFLRPGHHFGLAGWIAIKFPRLAFLG